MINEVILVIACIVLGYTAALVIHGPSLYQRGYARGREEAKEERDGKVRGMRE